MNKLAQNKPKSNSEPSAIDRSLDQPVYLQLAKILHQLILTGSFSPGEKLPSEAMLVSDYDVSPMTVRRAINYLAAQEVISTHKGKGTFVKAVDLEDAAFHLRDISEVFGREDETHIKVIQARFENADDLIAKKLAVQTGEKVIYMRRLLYINSVPAFYHQGYLLNIPTIPIVEAELEVTDLRGVFQGSGSELIKYGEVFLESKTLSDEECALLLLPATSAGMVLEHVFYGFDDQPLSWGWFVCDSQRLKLQSKVGLTISHGVRDERTR